MKRLARPSGITVVLLAVCVAMPLAGCDPSSLPEADRTVDVITGQRGLSVNPYSPRVSDRRIGRLLYRGLTFVGPDGMPSPDLAVELPTVANGGIRDGGRTVLYRVRTGLEWHDGAPLTARDIAFTIRALASGRLTDDPAEDFGIVTSAVATDDETVKITFSRPDSVMAWRLAPYVLPEHLLGSSADIVGSDYWRDPIGSGPYSVEEVRADGTLLLESAVKGAPALRVRPYTYEADAMRAFSEARIAVWPDALIGPAGAAESLSTTYGPVWDSMIFVQAPGTPWSDIAMRRAVVAMTTVTVPAGLPASAYPYGVVPPSRTTPDTRVAGMLFDSSGYRIDPAIRKRKRAGDRDSLDFYVGMHSITPQVRDETLFAERVWRSAGIGGGISLASIPIKGTWTEGGDLVRAQKNAFRYPFPAGRPWGWAFPYASGDEPSWEHPWGLNFAMASDERLQSAYESVRTAPDPATARARMAEVGERVYDLALQVDIAPVPERVLSKGVTGVQAWPSPDEALAQAVAWRPVGTASAEPTASPVR